MQADMALLKTYFSNEAHIFHKKVITIAQSVFIKRFIQNIVFQSSDVYNAHKTSMYNFQNQVEVAMFHNCKQTR